MFVSVVHSLSHTFTSVIDADYEGIGVNPKPWAGRSVIE